MMGKYSIEIIYLVSCIFRLYTTNFFFECFLEKRKYPIQYFYLAYVIYFVATSFLYLIHGSVLLNVCTYLIALFLITFLYRRNMYRRILAAISIYAIAMISELITAYLFTIINAQTIDNLLQDNGYKSMILTTACLIYFMIVKAITYFIKKREDVDLPRFYWMAIFAIPTGSIFNLYIIFLYSIEGEFSELHALNMIAVLSILVINFLVFYLYDKLLLDIAIKTQNFLLEQQIKYYDIQYKETRKMQEKISEMRHNLKNQLIGAESYLNEKDYDGLTIYIKNLLGGIELIKGVIYSGNTAIDTILYHKILDAENVGASIEMDLSVPENLRVNSDDFSILLGNSIDNAIESCCNLDKKDRRIFVAIKYKQNSLYLEISNPYNGVLNYNSSGELISSKKDRHNHGFGFKNIKKFVDQREYFMTVNTEANIFKLQILIFSKKEIVCGN